MVGQIYYTISCHTITIPFLSIFLCNFKDCYKTSFCALETQLLYFESTKLVIKCFHNDTKCCQNVNIKHKLSNLIDDTTKYCHHLFIPLKHICSFRFNNNNFIIDSSNNKHNKCWHIMHFIQYLI